MITEEQLKLLEAYRDRSYVSNILCNECSNFYSMIRNIINIPIILSSSVLALLNSSSFDQNEMKYANVIINSSVALILSISNNLKLSEKIGNFKNIGNKFNKLCHSIEDSVTNNRETITTENIKVFIDSYDNINEQLEFEYLSHIKKKVTKLYKEKRILPNTLNCMTSFIVST